MNPHLAAAIATFQSHLSKKQHSLRTALPIILNYSVTALLLSFVLALPFCMRLINGTKEYPDLAIEYATALVASILGVFVVLTLDRKTRAQLHVTAVTDETDNEETQDDGTKRKFLHANVVNPLLWRPHRCFQDRKTAHGTTAELQFYRYPTANEGTGLQCPLMKGKWRDNRVPEFDKYYKQRKELPHGYDDTRDIPSGEDLRNHLDIVMKIDGDSNCYGYNLEAELYPESRNRGRYKLPPGDYFVKVTLTTAGRSFNDYLQLHNGSDYSACYIRDIEPEEENGIKQLLSATPGQQNQTSECTNNHPNPT